jgi:hypothetical protein
VGGVGVEGAFEEFAGDELAGAGGEFAEELGVEGVFAEEEALFGEEVLADAGALGGFDLEAGPFGGAMPGVVEEAAGGGAIGGDRDEAGAIEEEGAGITAVGASGDIED